MCVSVTACAGRVGVESAPGDANVASDVAIERDAGSSASDSGYVTGGVLDASFDAGPASPLSRGTWVGTSVAPECPPSIALDPGNAIPLLQWVPCASGRAGCRTAKIDWHSRERDGRLQAVSAQRVGAKVYLPHVRFSHEWFTFVIQEGFDGPAVFATSTEVYAPLSCLFGGSLGEAGLAISGGYSGTARDVSFDNRPIFGFAELGNIAGARFRIAAAGEVLPGPSGFGLFSGERRIFATDGRLFDPKSLLLSGPKNGVGGSPVMVPDGVLRAEEDFAGLALVRNDGSLTHWLSARPMRRLANHSFDGRTRDTVTWIECDASGAAAELWAARYDVDPTKVVPRRVGKLPATVHDCGRGALVDGGFVAVTLAAERAAIYRISDGKGWSVSGEPGLSLVWPVWVDDAEIVLATTVSPDVQTNLLRIRRDTLGEPTLALDP